MHDHGTAVTAQPEAGVSGQVSPVIGSRWMAGDDEDGTRRAHVLRIELPVSDQVLAAALYMADWADPRDLDGDDDEEVWGTAAMQILLPGLALLQAAARRLDTSRNHGPDPATAIEFWQQYASMTVEAAEQIAADPAADDAARAARDTLHQAAAAGRDCVSDSEWLQFCRRRTAEVTRRPARADGVMWVTDPGDQG